QSYIDKCTNISTRGLDYTDIYGMKYKILRKSGQAAESNAVLAKILPMIDSLGTKSLNPHIQFLNDYIQYQIDDGDFQQALKYVDLILTDNDEVIKENSTVYNPELKRILVQSLYLKGQIFEKLYQRNSINTHIERAHKSYLSGIKALNEVKRAYKSERDRQNNIEQLKKIYRSGIRTSHVLYELTGEDRYLQNAFSFAESYLSNQLLEDLSRNLSIQQTNIPDSLLLQLRNLRLQESHLMSEIAILKGMRVKSQEDSTMLETYLFTLTENKNAYNTALRYLELNFPEFYGVNYDAKLVSIDKIRNKLSPSEALIEYFITEDAVFVFSISRDQAAFLKLPVPDIENILLFKSLMQEADNSDIESATRFREVSRRVYDQVLHKALTAIDNDAINKLYIIPDGELNLIPFELFMTSKTEDSNEDFGSLPYLIKDFNISYAHSSSVLFHQSERSPSGNVYFKAFAPSYNPEKNSAHKSYKRGDAWSELAFNEAEAKKLSDYFQGRVFTTSSATEKSFVQNHKGATILHMAMHANVDMENPQLSKLVFSAVNDSIFDNYLHSFEIYNMDINTQLTVLSACRTGAGNLANGEGVMSLARAFTYAGSRAVIMSHWQVDDQSTNELMNAFYKHLSEGQSKSKALQLAKIDYLKTASPNKQHPFFWSAFVMIGDDQPIGTTGDMPWHYLLIVIPGIYFIGLMYFKVKKVVR
ncbi:MAG: CHAT domain-containing protein, partial [Bacteroidota bacterium]